MLHLKIQQLLDALNTSPNMLYGQHFLINEQILEREFKEIMGMNKKNILEIGSGLGILTEKLVGQGKCIICTEKDEVLSEYLKKQGLKVYGDIFRHKNLLSEVELVIGNIPYDICTGLFELLIQYHKEFIGIVPHSFVKLLTTSLFYQHCYVTVLQEHIEGSAFYPIAKTQSALIYCYPKVPETIYEQFIHCLMQHYKHKKLKNALHETYIQIKGVTKREAKKIINNYQFDYLDKQVKKLSYNQREILCQQLNHILS